jgi:hypothetical protein
VTISKGQGSMFWAPFPAIFADLLHKIFISFSAIFANFLHKIYENFSAIFADFRHKIGVFLKKPMLRCFFAKANSRLSKKCQFFQRKYFLNHNIGLRARFSKQNSVPGLANPA